MNWNAWNQPLCNNCWAAEEPGQEPIREVEPDRSYRCASCGAWTWSGIWARRDPGGYRYPYDPEERPTISGSLPLHPL